MSILVSGVLLDPAGRPIPNAEIVLTAISTSFVVLGGFTTRNATGSDASYSFLLEMGNYAVNISKNGANFYYGAITITNTTVPSSLNQLLLQNVMEAEVPPNFMAYFQQVQAEVVASENRSKQYALDSEKFSLTLKETIKIFPTEEVAKRNIQSGFIVEGEVFGVKLIDADGWCNEYVNQGGVAVLTGDKILNERSAQRLNQIISNRIYSLEKRLMNRDGVAGFAFPVLSTDKRVVGITNDGGFSGAYLRIPGIGSIPPRDGPRLVAVVMSEVDGRVGIGFNPQTGLTFALLDDQSISHIADKIGGGGTNVPEIRGTWGSNVFNPRHYIGDMFNTASVTDRAARTFDARQLINGGQDTLVMAAGQAKAMEIILVYGQSNAGPGGSTGRVVDIAPWPHSTVGFAGVNGSTQQGTVHMAGTTLTDFIAALDYSTGQSPAICSCYGITQYNALMGRDDTGYIAATAWHGSQPINSFLPNAQSGFWNYENAITFLERSVAIAHQYGRSAVLRVMPWIQGEAGPTGRENHATQLNNLFDTVLPGFKAATGQSEPVRVAIWQTNMSKAASGENYASQAQWDIAQNREDCFLAGPMYQFKLGDEASGPSTVHTGPEGRLMIGETYADVYASIVDTGKWKPIQPVSAVLSGNVIDITFEGTPLDRPGARLAVDDDWIPTTPNNGISYTDGNAPPSITSVAITGPRTARVTLASAPIGSGKTLRYAINAFNDVPYWPTRRGNIMVETDRLSWWHRQGVNVPRYVRHYSIRFEISVTE